MRRRVAYGLTWKGRLVAVAILVGAALGPARWVLPAVGGAVVVDDRPSTPADLIVAEVTENPSFAVLRHAEELRRAGLAPRVALTRYVAGPRLARAGVVLPPVFDRILAAYTDAAGLPDSALATIPIEVDDPVTWNTARQVVDYCAAAGVRRLIVVGQPFHSRRSSWSYRHFADARGIDVRMSPAWSGMTAGNWWQTKDGVLLVGQEAAKAVGYRLRRWR